MKVAVTGSTGLIGTKLCSHLRAGGHEVVRVVRKALGSNEESIYWNPATGEADPADFSGVDAIVHLAGVGIGDRRWSNAQKQRILGSRVDGTALIAATAAAADPKPSVLISGSAVGYYGDRGDEVLDESSGPGVGFTSEVCQKWEAAAKPAIDAGIRTAFIRTGIVLDSDGGALSKVLPLFRFGLGGRIGDGSQWMSWISLTDEVRAITWLLENDVSGPVNLVSPNPVTNQAYTDAISRAVHRPAFLPVPKFGPRLLLGAELSQELLYSGQRATPAVLEKGGFEFEHPTIDEALGSILSKG